MNALRNIISGCSLLALCHVAYADIYDPVTKQLTIPFITVAGTTYNNVIATVANVVSFNTGVAGVADTYDAVNQVLTIPRITVGATTYTNVQVKISSVVSINKIVLADFSSTIDPLVWRSSNGWTNGGMFNNGWASGNAVVSNGSLVLQLDNLCTPTTLCSGKPYKSGEYASNAKYGYGTYSASMSAAKGAGLVTSLFTYNATPHDEIDIEILGKDTTQVQFNYFVNGVGGHEKVVNLGFDASLARHTYTIIWLATGISWYVDGVLKHQVVSGVLPTAPGQFMANLWPAIGVDTWTGVFSYSATPIKAYYDYLRYEPAL